MMIARRNPLRLAQRARGITTPSREEAVQTAQKYAQKAYEQGTVVAGKAFEVGKKYSGSTGERVAGFWSSYQGQIFYNLQVARELLKQIYVAERLKPPTSFAEIQQVYRLLWQKGSSITYWREIANNGEWKRIGIYGLEAYGIFHIGEMIGRRHVVGYQLK